MPPMARASISTHVLDTAYGRPRAGIRVGLFQGGHLVGEGETDADGRIRELATELEPGEYRLVFSLGGGFFHEVSLVVRLEGGHSHVPLLLSPFGATVYRGS